MKNEKFAGTHTLSFDELNTKKLYRRIKRNLYWIILFCAVGGILGVVISNFYRPSYTASTSILVNTDAKKQSLANAFGDPGVLGFSTSSLTGQIGIIKSFSLNFKALNNLRWNESISEKYLLGNKDLYLNEPFKVDVDDYRVQTKMVPITIKPVSIDELEVSIHEKTQIGDVIYNIDLSERIKYGQRFTNNFFDFTLRKIEGASISEGKEYILIFNSLESLTNTYVERLAINVTDENANIIHLDLEGQNHYRDVSYLNELMKVYIEFGLEEKNRNMDNTLRFINNQLVGVSDSLESASKDFTNFRSRNRIVNLGQEASLVVSSLEDIESQEAASRLKLQYYDNLKRYLDDASQMKDLVAPSVVGITDPTLNTLVAKLSDLYGQREVLSYTVQDKNPNLLSLDNEIEYTKKQLKENITNLVNNNNSELNLLSVRKQRIGEQLSRLPKTEQDLIDIKRGFDLNSELYTFLMRKKAEVGIEKASNSPEARILDFARVNFEAPTGPGRLQIIAVGVIAGAGVIIMAILISTYYSQTLEDVDDIEGNTNLPIIGSIFTNHLKTDLPVAQFTNSAVTETFRNLRSALYKLTSNKKGQVYAIHSSTVGEGKSFTSANLASIFAINNEKVLLVEATLRKPTLQSIFGVTKEVGLSTYLMGKISFEEIVFPTKIKGLSFVPSGPTPLYTAELLNNGPLDKFIKTAREKYDVIVMDNVPTDILSDAAIVAKYADVNLYILRLKYTKKSQLKSLNKLAEDEVINNLKLIINDITPRVSKKKLKEYGYL